MHDHHTNGIAVLATRRRTLAAAIVAAVALRQGRPADAKSTCRKKARKSVDKTCARMRDECLTYYIPRCAETSDPDACRADMTICCGRLAEGSFTEHVTCLYAPR
jgi:hypothetical protein